VLQAANVPVKEIPTTDEFTQDLALMAKACNAETKLVFLANPNNPTGVYSSGEAMRDFLQRVPEHVIVVVDEAYFEYALADDYESALEMRDVRDRLVVTRTFSKCYGLAGLRVGYGIAPPPLVNYLNRVREPFNSNLVGQAAALAALDETEHLGRSVQANEEGRALLEAGLQTLGLRWIPSQTNFLLVRMPKSGQAVYDAMLREGVIVRPVGGYGLPEWIRITIGTPEQTQRCVDALSTVLSA
jgi:histidinol-phosphate aminotransferase